VGEWEYSGERREGRGKKMTIVTSFFVVVVPVVVFVMVVLVAVVR